MEFEDTISPSNFNILPPPIELYESQEIALSSIQLWAQEHGYTLRIRDSKKRQKGDKHFYIIYLEYDRAGKHKPTPKVDGKSLRKNSTRRRECPFRCIIRQPKKEPNAHWTVAHCNAPHNTHNHGPSHFPTAYPIHRRYAKRKRPEILEQIRNNKLFQISAPETLSSLRMQFPDAPVILRDIENEYSEIKKTMNHGLPAIQAIIAKLGSEFQYHYALDGQNRLERVLFFHNTSLQLLHLFPRSYILDATYQTNRFNLPFVNVVGFTATNRSFVIDQAFLTHEEEEDYIWILQWIRNLYHQFELPVPESITTDKTGGLHNACGAVWPEIPHLLCRWHINKDVRGYCQKHWLEKTPKAMSNKDRKALIDEKVAERRVLA